ncbi:MAG TPA: VOC family protein [Methylomirabilota bacterium]|jgi:catechol 2,3-dioxygenase|nr:VOC family protein [Methylomirabilota bacterium]
MALRPMSLDHVNIFVRNAERSHRWYTDVFGLHTQDTMTHPGTEKLRAVFLACDKDHAHDIALFEIGEDARGQEKGQVGLNHVAWRMATLDDLAEMYRRLKKMDVPINVRDHSVSIGIYFDDPDGNGLEAYFELPRSEWNRERPFSEKGGKGRFPGPWDEAAR